MKNFASFIEPEVRPYWLAVVASIIERNATGFRHQRVNLECPGCRSRELNGCIRTMRDEPSRIAEARWLNRGRGWCVLAVAAKRGRQLRRRLGGHSAGLLSLKARLTASAA